MQIAVFATICPFLFGTLVGALVGYYGGWPKRSSAASSTP